MSTIDRDRMVLVGRVREVVVILIVVGSVAKYLEPVNSFEPPQISASKPVGSIRPTHLSMLLPWLARTSA
jgi:hypothetical protein